MSEKEVMGNFCYDKDFRRYHRFQIETEEGIVGAVYVPKDRYDMPKKLILVYANKKPDDVS